LSFSARNEELRDELRERGVIVGYGTVWRFFAREAITFKKSVRAAEQERPDVAASRQQWKEVSQNKFLRMIPIPFPKRIRIVFSERKSYFDPSQGEEKPRLSSSGFSLSRPSASG
jgi:hypothetical protein